MREYFSDGVESVIGVPPEDDAEFATSMLNEWQERAARRQTVAFPRVVSIDQWKECVEDAHALAPGKPFRIWLSTDMFVIFESANADLFMAMLSWRAEPDVTVKRSPAPLDVIAESIQEMLDKIVAKHGVMS